LKLLETGGYFVVKETTTYHVTNLGTGTGEDEDCLWAIGATTLLKLISSARAKLADFEGIGLRCGKCHGRGRSQADEHGKGEELHLEMVYV
jgi:hypothetical protein